MRIGILHQYAMGGSGSGIYTLHLAKALAMIGHEVHVLCRNQEAGESCCADAPGVHVHRLDTSLAPVMYPRADAPGCPIFIDLSGAELSAHLRELTAKVEQFWWRVRPEALIVNHLYPLPVALSKARLPRRVPVAVCSHGTALQYLINLRSDIRRQAVSALRQLGGRLVALNEGMRRRLLEFDRNLASRIVEVPVGVDSDLFRPALDRDDQREAAGILVPQVPGRHRADAAAMLRRVRLGHIRLGVFAGRMVPDKGVWPLLETLHACNLRSRGLGFLMVGDGELRPQVERAFRRLRREGHDVLHVRHLNRRAMGELYRCADFAVVPSTAGEAFPLVLVESLASGIPVVAPTHTGFGELVPEMLRELDSTGAACPRLSLGDTPTSIRRRLWKALIFASSVPSSREQQERLRALVVPRFDWSGVAARYDALFCEGRQLERRQASQRYGDTAFTPNADTGIAG